MTSLSKDISITFVAQALVFVLGLGAFVLLARLLGPVMVGSYRILVLIFDISMLFVLFGLGAANVFHGAKEHAILPVLAGNSLVAGTLFGTIGAAALLLLSTWPSFQMYLDSNGLRFAELRWLVWVLPIMLVSTYLREIIRASGDIAGYNVVPIVQASTLLVGVFISVFLLDYGLTGAVVAWMLAQVFSMLWVLERVLHITKYRLALDWQIFRHCLRFGLHLYPGNIMQFLNYRLDIFMVSFFLTPAAVGYYTTAGGLAEKLWQFPHAIRTSLLHRVSGASPEAQIHLTTARIIRLLVLGMGALCILFAAFSYWITLILFGPDFLPAVPAIIALLPGIWALSIGKIVSIYMAGSGRPQISSYGAAISLVCTLILNLLLIPRLGIVGAAITSSVAYSVSTIFMTAVYLRTSNLSVADILLPTTADIRLIRSLAGKFGHRISHGFTP